MKSNRAGMLSIEFGRKPHNDEYEEESHEKEHKMKKKPMQLILAHFNPNEIKEMDYAQGGATRIPGTNERHYKGLEKKLSHPDGERIFIQALERHAEGGMIGETAREIENMKRKGRNGDTEMAYIGPNTRRIFDKAMADLTGNRSKNENPHTRKPEYFGFSKFLGGVGKTLSHGASSLGNVAMKALPGAVMGGMMGGPEGALMGGMSGAMAPSGGGGGHSQQPSAPSYQPGHAQQQMGAANQYGQQQLGNAHGSGSNMLQGANQFGQNAMQHLNNAGQGFIHNMANRASNALSGGTQYGQNKMQQGTDYGQNAMDQGAMYGSSGMNQANRYGQNMANNYDQNQQQQQQQNMNNQQNAYNQRWGQPQQG